MPELTTLITAPAQNPSPAFTATNLRIAIITDAAAPQVNGVVRTLKQLGEELEALGHETLYITPDMFTTLPMPTYKEIRIALFPARRLKDLLLKHQPDAVHIATEGPLGIAARRYCVRHNLPFTTSFHTRFPEYLKARIGIPLRWTYAWLRHFHKPSKAMMVATPRLRDEMQARGFTNTAMWSRGVDTELFHPNPALHETEYLGLPRPLWLYVGRVAVEKNISAFLTLDLPGSKLVVGEGPKLEKLKKKHPEVTFTGALFGADLAKAYAASDCFVFPSKTDTFGLVLIEALATGTPVAAYPVQGPLDVIGSAPVGALNEDLRVACLAAIQASRKDARTYALNFSWASCTRQFLSHLALLEHPTHNTLTAPLLPPALPAKSRDPTPRPLKTSAL